MAPRRRLALVVLPVLAAQVALALGAAALCGLRTERGDLRAITTSGDPRGWRMPVTTWSDYHYLGYPVPWIEYREDRFGVLWTDVPATFVAFVGCDWLVPVCLFLLALALPPLLAADLRRGWMRIRSKIRSPRPRWHRLLLVLVGAAVCGLTVTAVDVITNPWDSWYCGVGHVPFERPPGRWLRESKSDPIGGPYLADPPHVAQLREWRKKWFPGRWGYSSEYDADHLTREWTAHTWRTGWGFALGLTVAAGLLRPWRRTPAGTT